MGTTQDHRKYAEECVAMARMSVDDGDKALWLTLAQSWVRLAEHVARQDLDNEPCPEVESWELAPDETSGLAAEDWDFAANDDEAA